MPPDLIEKVFSEFLWRMNSIEEVTPQQEVKLRIAFQEGVIKTAAYLIEKFDKKIPK